MDEVDIKIIAELLEDGRKPFSAVAGKIGVSTQTVIKRYNELKEKGTIQQCSVRLNMRKIGYEGTAVLLITCSPGSNIPEVINQIKKTQNVVVVTEAMGDFEGYAMALYRNTNDLYERIQQIKKLPNIESADVSLIKDAFAVFPPNLKQFIFNEPILKNIENK